jgi:uncharacterized protein YbjT (DUF2867 family)
VDAVTGALSFTGSYVARALLARGGEVRTISRRPDPAHPLAERVEFARLQFDDERALARSLEGATTLFNTYWVRFPRSGVSWKSVVSNTRTLLRAAAAARVGKVVQLSVANASERSPYGYFRAKALAEQALRDSGLAYAIVRPTLIFGRGELLFSNIAWALRRSPVFLLPRGGRYATQPVAAEDVAELAVDLASAVDNVVGDAAGPATYSFAELVEAVRGAVGARARLVSVPPRVLVAATRVAAAPLRDVLIVPEELAALGDDLLTSSEPARGRRRLEDWLRAEADTLGRSFVSERRRNWS